MKKFLDSARIIPLSFLAAILVGTAILMLPISTADGNGAGIITALFTSTTSICVTGLVVVDTYAYWSLFGKIVILILIQLGGLGIITVTSVIMLILKRKFSLSQTVLIHDAFNLDSTKGLTKFLLGVLKGTLLVEMLGALVYMIDFIPKYGVLRGIWYSVFTAISAFCNAGIDILGPDSLVGFQKNPLVLINTITLIVLGGLGYVVWFDVLNGIKNGIKKRYDIFTIYERLSEHSKLVIAFTMFLILSGAVAVFISEFANSQTIGDMSIHYKVLNSIFQSVTFRTAGFATVPQQYLTDTTCWFGSVLMFIGGSPVGTAGGVKTVTVFLVLANVDSFIKSRNKTVVFNRELTEDMIRKATAIITVSFLVTFVMMQFLMILENVSLVDAMYETFSATATVGLSRALTPTLGRAGRLIIIICMYLGRIGPISMALFFGFKGQEKNKIRHAKGNFFVG